MLRMETVDANKLGLLARAEVQQEHPTDLNSQGLYTTTATQQTRTCLLNGNVHKVAMACTL